MASAVAVAMRLCFIASLPVMSKECYFFFDLLERRTNPGQNRIPRPHLRLCPIGSQPTRNPGPLCRRFALCGRQCLGDCGSLACGTAFCGGEDFRNRRLFSNCTFFAFDLPLLSWPCSFFPSRCRHRPFSYFPTLPSFPNPKRTLCIKAIFAKLPSFSWRTGMDHLKTFYGGALIDDQQESTSAVTFLLKGQPPRGNNPPSFSLGSERRRRHRLAVHSSKTSIGLQSTPLLTRSSASRFTIRDWCLSISIVPKMETASRKRYFNGSQEAESHRDFGGLSLQSVTPNDDDCRPVSARMKPSLAKPRRNNSRIAEARLGMRLLNRHSSIALNSSACSMICRRMSRSAWAIGILLFCRSPRW